MSRYIDSFIPEEHKAYELSLKQLRDYHNTIVSALERGREEGRAEGRAEGEAPATLKMATKMKAQGLDTKTIASYTDLSEDEIEKL